MIDRNKRNRGVFRLAAAVVLLSALFLTGCGEKGDSPAAKAAAQKNEKTAKETTDRYKELTAKEAKARMDSGDDLVIVDARTEREFDYMHISGAVLIPNEEIGDEPLTQVPDLKEEIIVYSRSATAGRQVAEKLADAGYENVATIGSMDDWPYAVEMSDDSPAGFT